MLPLTGHVLYFDRSIVYLSPATREREREREREKERERERASNKSMKYKIV